MPEAASAVIVTVSPVFTAVALMKETFVSDSGRVLTFMIKFFSEVAPVLSVTTDLRSYAPVLPNFRTLPVKAFQEFFVVSL